MIVDYFNLPYFLAVIAFVCYFLIVYFCLKNKSKKTQYIVLLILGFIGFAVHFLKQIVYNNPEELHKSTLENICAISTVVIPFLLLFNKKQSFINDTVIFLSVIGGFFATFIPTEALNKNLLEFDVLRFYINHFNIFTISVLVVVFNLYVPSFKKCYMLPLGFLLYQLIICANVALVCFTGLSTKEGFTPLELFLDSQYLNNSFTFGPTQDMGFFSDLINALIPNFMKFELNGRPCYWPVICLLVPSLFVIPVYLLTLLPIKIASNKYIEPPPLKH